MTPSKRRSGGGGQALTTVVMPRALKYHVPTANVLLSAIMDMPAVWRCRTKGTYKSKEKGGTVSVRVEKVGRWINAQLILCPCAVGRREELKHQDHQPS